MNKKEMIDKIDVGVKFTHEYFTENEWMSLSDCGDFIFEDGVKCDQFEFWLYRDGEGWDNGWTLIED